MPKSKSILTIILIVSFWYWLSGLVSLESLHDRYQKAYLKLTNRIANVPQPPAEFPQLTDSLTCEGTMPLSGSQFTYGTDPRASSVHSRFSVSNEHNYSLLLNINEISTNEPYKVLLLHPGTTGLLNLPLGHYELSMQVGTIWCNLRKGFQDGMKVISTKKVEIVNNKVTNLRVLSIGYLPADFMLLYDSTLGLVDTGKSRAEGIGSLNLQRKTDHFEVAGSVNRVPVNFLIDTGATLTSISTKVAQKAGVQDCKLSQTYTANGFIDTCIGTVGELTIGQFRLKNVKVSYSKEIGNTSLLGMNVIEQFYLEQQGDMMRLSLD